MHTCSRPLSLSVASYRDIDKVDDLMAEITEQQEVAQEISDVISRPGLERITTR